MKALTLIQPWANLVARGAKQIETRSWSTGYRGPLAIHAALSFPPEARRLCDREPIRSNLGCRVDQLPLGGVLAVCRLVDCRPITLENLPPEPELSFGVYAPGRWAWLLAEVHMFPQPIPAKGKLGLWDWTAGGAWGNLEIADYLL